MGYDHLFYVCVHCCAAIEPEEVDADAVPVPAPQDVTRPQPTTEQAWTCGCWTPG